MSSGDKGQVGTESPRPLRKRRTRMANDKRIADDEFMAAAIGDVEWLRQSLREQKGKINFDKNVSLFLQGMLIGIGFFVYNTNFLGLFSMAMIYLVGNRDSYLFLAQCFLI